MDVVTRPADITTHHAAYEPPIRQWESGRPDRGPRKPLRPAWTETDRLVVVDLDRDWLDDAACKGHDPNLWFPGHYQNGAQAKAICRQCPVRGACLEYAIANDERGIWGASSERERRRLRRRRVA